MTGPAADADRRLRDLRAARDAITTNLLDLEAEGTYALLKAGDGLSGTTAQRARPALARVPELWRGLQLLDDLVDRADDLRGNGRLSDQKARELLELLTGPSIDLPPEIRPLAERSLTASPVMTPALTPRQLLDAMEKAFAPLRDVVAAVDAAWTDLRPRLERATAEAAALAGELPGDPDVAAARAALVPVAELVAQDPLAATDELVRAEAVLATARDRAAEARAASRRLADDLAAADRTATEIATLIDAGRTHLADSRRTVREPEGLLDPLDPTLLTDDNGLEPWLARLREVAAGGDVERATRGLGHWRSLADQTLAAARQVAEANARPAARRRQLRGLLRAAQAKAAAAGRADDPGLQEIAQRASTALAAPCDLVAAQAAVDAYVTGLRRAPRGRSRTSGRIAEPT